MSKMEYEAPEIRELSYLDIVQGASCVTATYESGLEPCDPDNDTEI